MSMFWTIWLIAYLMFPVAVVALGAAELIAASLKEEEG